MARRLSLSIGFAVGIGMALTSGASAHFLLNEPPSRAEQDEFGSPQKSAPCGLSDRASVPDESTPTGIVTAVQSGSTLTISIRETIFHPGHFRVALAPDMAGLPADPPVTAGGGTPCGSTIIDPNPAFPVLADGQLPHTSGLGNQNRTFDVQIPAGMTCTNCVLQVTQFMSNHDLNNPGGCFYHHCAAITVTDTTPPPDAAVPGGGGDDEGEGGCCGAGGGGATASMGLAAIVVLVVMLLMRRRRCGGLP